MFNKFLYIFLILFTCYLPPLFCGGDSESGDGFDNEDDDVDGTGIEIFGIPILFPYVDYHRGRKLIQLPPKLAPFVPIFEKDNLLSKINKEVSDDKIPDPEILDEYNRKIYSLNHGDPNNPYLILDHGTLNIGILGGISFSDTQTYVLQYNLLAKIFYTSGGWSEREADSYNEAKNLKQLKVPSKAKDFDSWNNGDDMYINGSMVISIYAGISAYIADARAGGILMGNWSKHITKLDNNLVRIAFTKEGGFGVAARIQALPLTKIEGKKLKDWEGTLVFDFDRSTEDGKKALKHALNNRILLKKQDTDEDNVTLLTTRTSGRNKSSRNLQIGMPFIARARASYHKINISQETINERNNKKTTIASKGYMKQKAYRYVNIPKNNKDKKWQHFTYTNFHYNKISEGCAKVVKNDTTKEIKRSDIKLAVEISFTHDKVKVKEADDYKKDIAKQVGINNFVIDLGYEKDYQIGYVGLTYRLNVNTEALDANEPL